MIHLPILPVIIPFTAAIASLLLHKSLRLQRIVSLLAMVSLVPVAIGLFAAAATSEIFVYALGNWPAPFGIVLVLDRLSALMVGITVAVAVPALVYAVATGTDARGLHFHALWQFQTAGLCGAFLTGDLFNLFVFFELLLLASYGLLVHGHGRGRAGAGLTYVILNLAGSVAFLIAVAVLYGTLGTLNIADMALVMAEVSADNRALVRAGGVVLLSVFALKAALLPLSFWLPRVYSAAAAPVAALFAIMTKVGVYSILRVTGVAFQGAAFSADILQPWLLPFAVATIVAGTVGALAATRLGVVVANLVVISTGMLLAAISSLSVDGIAAAMYYIVNTTLVTAGFFLLADRMAAARGAVGDALVQGDPVGNPALLGLAYLALALAVAGMPPFAGFVGKLMIMQSLQYSDAVYAIWLVIVVSGLVVLLVLARAASVIFWEARGEPSASTAHFPWPVATLLMLVFASPALVATAEVVAQYGRATAEQLLSTEAYVDAVVPAPEVVERELRP